MLLPSHAGACVAGVASASLTPDGGMLTWQIRAQHLPILLFRCL